MAREPINLFSARGDAKQVRNLLLTWFPDAEVVCAGSEGWSEILLRLDDSTLCFLHSPEYYLGPDWPEQKAGMQGFLARFPLGDREAQTMSTIGTFQFCLGTRFQPDYDLAGDERLTILGKLAEVLDGVLFMPSSLRDPQGRILVSSDGNVDPDAEWPMVGRLANATAFGEKPAVAEPEWEAKPPTAQRVARRAVALMILSCRAVLERDHKNEPNSEEQYERLFDWATDLEIAAEFEPWERDALRTRPGQLDPQTAINAMWRIEGLTLLAWALGRYELLLYDRISDVDGVWAAIGLYDTERIRQLLATAQLLPAEELDAVRKQYLGYHWRLRDFQWNKPQAMDFVAFSKDCWFGSFDISAFQIIENDLALAGHRIDKAPAEVFSVCRSLSVERHQAINWLCWGPEVYSEADVST